MPFSSPVGVEETPAESKAAYELATQPAYFSDVKQLVKESRASPVIPDDSAIEIKVSVENPAPYSVGWLANTPA